MEDYGREPAVPGLFHENTAQDPPPNPSLVNPRRKYQRQTTSPQNENKRSADSDDDLDGLMSAGEELEMDDLASDAGSEADEETGLTGKESRKYLHKQRQSVPLDARIAGNTTITKEAKKLADQQVLKNLLVNATLIGLWYIFSLSISIVSITVLPRGEASANRCLAVQQMDVWLRAPRFPFPFIYHLTPHACSVLPRLSRSPRST